MKKAALALLILLCVFIPGCDFKDIDRRSFIVVLGLDIDKTTKDIILTAKAAVPTEMDGDSGGGGGGENTFVIYKVRAHSMGEAFRRIKAQIHLEPDYAHMKLIIFSEDFIKSTNFNLISQFFTRRRDFQLIAWEAIGRPSAEAVLRTRPDGERFTGDGLFLKFDQGVESEYEFNIRNYEMFGLTQTPGATIVLPVLEPQNNKVIMDKLVIFNGDLNDRVEIKKDEVKFYNLMTRGVRNGYILLNKNDKNDRKEHIGVGVANSKASIKITDENGQMTCTVKIKIDAQLEETERKYRQLKDIEKSLEDEINNTCQELLKKFQQHNVDPLYIERKYWSTHPDYELGSTWRDKIYPNMKFKVETNLKINYSGLLE